MTKKMEVFQLLGEATASIFPLGRDILRPQFETYFSQQRYYGPTFLAYQLSPGSLTLALLRNRNPYNNPAALEEDLAGAAEEGYLDPDGEGGYQISESGADAIESIHQVFYNHLSQICQFPEEDLGSLAEMLGSLVESADQVGLEGGAYSFDCSFGGLPLAEPGSLGEIDQLLDHLNAFRDDAHIAAWKPLGVSGQLWEALTFVWNSAASSAEQLAEKLPYRNYAAADYQLALDQLAKKGWIQEGEGGFQITDEGKGIRDQAEADTNTFYFQPWAALSAEELDRLAQLLQELIESNQALA